MVSVSKFALQTVLNSIIVMILKFIVW